MKSFVIRHLRPIVFVGIFLTFSITFTVLSPEEILGMVGVENAYLFMFLLAFAGGVTTFSGIPYHIILVAFASGGMNPWLLGMLAAGGVMAGDSTSYLLGRQGRELLSARMTVVVNTLRQVEKQYPKLVPIVFFLYGALLPFSNDILIIPAGLMGYPFWRIMVPLGLGNVVFNVGVALMAVYATDLVAVFV